MDRDKEQPSDLPDYSQDGLTEKESKVLKLMASGISRNDIANQLFISQDLMKSYVFNIYKKIGAKEVDKVLQAAIRSIKIPWVFTPFQPRHPLFSRTAESGKKLRLQLKSAIISALESLTLCFQCNIW